MSSNVLPTPLTAGMLLGIGGAHIDRRGQVSGEYAPGASNPGVMREEVGGVVFNALRNAKQLGAHCEILSIRGGDSGGDAVERAIADTGITDRSAVFLDRVTASYTALIDRNGDLIVGFADMELYDLFPKQLRRLACRAAINDASALLCDANLPAAALKLALAGPERQRRYAIGISPAKVVRLAGLLDRLTLLFLNRKEAAALTGLGVDAPTPEMVAALRVRGLSGGVITDGGATLTGFDASGVWALQPPPPQRVADATGAGDALAGATIAALMRGTELQDAMREGVAAALLTLETPDVVAQFDRVILAGAMMRVPQTIAG